jgi:hypothetical protein
MRHTGWAALAVVGALLFVATALGGTYAFGLALVDGAVLDAVGTALTIGLSLVFWKWITLGAWVRAQPPDADQAAEPAAEPIGPWGMVGRVLMIGLVGVLVAGVLWGNVVDRSSTNAAQEVRSEAEREARRVDLTVGQVEQARALDDASTGDDRAPTSVAGLLDVPGARVVDTSVDEGRAALLLRPDTSPPCVVVSVDANGIIASRITTAC